MSLSRTIKKFGGPLLLAAFYTLGGWLLVAPTASAAPETHNYQNWGYAIRYNGREVVENLATTCRQKLKQNPNDSCANTLLFKCESYRTQPYKDYCYGSFLEMRKCTAPNNAGAALNAYNACLDRNTAICAPLAANLKDKCVTASKSSFFGSRTVSTGENGETPGVTVDGGDQVGESGGGADDPAEDLEANVCNPEEDNSGNEHCNLDLIQFESRLGGASGEDCKGVKLAFNVGCSQSQFSNPIMAYAVAVLRFLTYGVGVVVILMIVVGGIQYATAGGNAQSVQAARNRVFNAFIALLLYIFAFALLNFVIPGGLIG